MERTLLERGHEAEVRQVRSVFEATLADDYRPVIERITGRRMIDFFSQIMVAVPQTLELFQLGEPLDDQ